MYRESSGWINSSSWKACAWNWKQRTQKKIPGSFSRYFNQWLESSSNVCNVSSQRLAKMWLKLHKSQTGGKGIVKTCTMMKKGKGLNKNVGIKSLHHFVQRLLVPSVRQQVAKPQVLTRFQYNCSKQEERQCTSLETHKRMCTVFGTTWRVVLNSFNSYLHRLCRHLVREQAAFSRY